MKHISYLFASVLLIASYNSFADDINDASAQESTQCAHCACMVPAEKVTKGAVATCACCSSHDETQRSFSCPCDQTAATQECGAECNATRSCCTKSVTLEEETVQCAHCPCMVPVSEHQTKSPATCACCQSSDGRSSLCMCEEHAAVNDCLGCGAKKKVDENNNQ